MDVLHDNISPSDLIEWAGIKAGKHVMGKNLSDEIWENLGKMQKLFFAWL